VAIAARSRVALPRELSDFCFLRFVCVRFKARRVSVYV
jgi:hypothetical protein